MRIKKTLASVVLAGAMVLGLAGKVKASLYDDFSAPTLDTSKWEVRQDYEGWPFMDESYLDTNAQNFHTKQNSVGNAGTFLVPKHNFSAGEILDYDIIYNSGSGNNISMLLVDQKDRWGFVGLWNSAGSPFGNYHIHIEFSDSYFDTTIKNDEGTIDINRRDFFSSSATSHELYIGSRTGHNGTCHFDYDNFYIVPEPATLGLLSLGALSMLKRRKDGK